MKVNKLNITYYYSSLFVIGNKNNTIVCYRLYFIKEMTSQAKKSKRFWKVTTY